MNDKRKTILWTSAALAFVVAAFVLRDILLPFVVGAALAYALDPLVGRLQRIGFGRSAAALSVVGVFYVSLVSLIVFLAPMLSEEIAYFIHQAPSYVERLRTMAADPGRPWLTKLIDEGVSEIQKSRSELTSLGANLSANLLQTLWSDGRALVSVVSLLVVSPIVAFYLLVDRDELVATLDRLTPAAQRQDARELASEIHRTIDVVLRGEAVIGCILAVYYAVALSFAGVNHAWLIGLVSGVVSFVPYMGLLTGAVLSTGVAIVQFWPAWNVLAVIAGIFALGQIVSDYVLTPHFIGARVRLHPLSTMFAIAAFGYLMGFVGLLVAVPLAAAIGVVVRHLAAREVQPAAGDKSANTSKFRWWSTT